MPQMAKAFSLEIGKSFTAKTSRNHLDLGGGRFSSETMCYLFHFNKEGCLENNIYNTLSKQHIQLK